MRGQDPWPPRGKSTYTGIKLRGWVLIVYFWSLIMRAYFLTDFVQVCTNFVFVKMSALTTYLPFDIDLRFPLSCAFFYYSWGAWNSWFFWIFLEGGGRVNGRCWARAYVWRKNEISLNEHLLKCLAWIQKRLSGERAIMGPPAKRHLNDVCWRANFSWYL